MKSLLIVGASGFGRQVYTWAMHCPEYQRDWTIQGFLDDNSQALDGFDYPVPVLGSIREHRPAPDEVFVCGLGIPEVKKKCVTTLKQRGASFIRLIHPTTVIGHNVELGEGVVVCPKVVLACDIRIGDFVTFNVGVGVGHDVQIDDWATLCGHSDLSGHAQVGNSAFIAPHVCALPQAVIGDQAFVGTGSIVLKRVPTGAKVFGVPARMVPSIKNEG